MEPPPSRRGPPMDYGGYDDYGAPERPPYDSYGPPRGGPGGPGPAPPGPSRYSNAREPVSVLYCLLHGQYRKYRVTTHLENPEKSGNLRVDREKSGKMCSCMHTLWLIETVATRCQILRLKCTKFDFGWGSAPDPAGGAYSAPQTP